MQKSVCFNNIAIVYVKGSAYRIHIWYMSKNHATNIMNRFNLIFKTGVLRITYKMSEKSYYPRNRDAIPNRSKHYIKMIKKD